MLTLFRTLLACALIGWGGMASAAAVVLGDPNVKGTYTTLIGAKGVNVGGVMYDVSFEDTSCSGQYINCNPVNFSFHTKANADLASAALLAQVFVDGPGGHFDTNSSLTFGCYGPCSVLTAYDVVGFNKTSGNNSDVLTSLAINADAEIGDGIGAQQFFATAYMQSWNQWVYAVWSPSTVAPTPGPINVPTVSTVPEPETYTLVLASLGLMGAVVRRKRAPQA